MQMNLEILKKLNIQECLKLVEVMNTNIPDPMYVWDLEEDKIYFTKMVSENFVLQPKESMGFELQEILNLTYPLDRPRIEKQIFRIANGLERDFVVEYRMVNRKGKRVWINNKGQQITIENGERRVIIGCCSTSVFDTRVDKLTGLSLGLNWREDLLSVVEEGSQGHLFIADVDDLAAINAPEPRMLTVQPWDTSAVQAIEKALIAANLGINPVSDGKVLRLPIPELSQERRNQFVKQVKNRGEEGKVAIRNIRRDGNEVAKKAQKGGEITEDQLKQILDEIQKLTDKSIEKLDKDLAAKEKELMSI